jgi:hypothetical protein
MPDTYIKNANTWSKLKKAFIKNSGTWSEIKTVWIKNAGVWQKAFVNETVVNVSSQNNINLRTLYTNQTGDSSSSSVRVVYNINGNIGSTSTATASIVTGTWPAGSEIVINVANGVYVVGAGGIISSTGARNGGNGGTAISLSYNVTIVNSGVIGGGGGAGGGVNIITAPYGTLLSNGGNGAGLTAGSGATLTAGGAAGGVVETNACSQGFCQCWYRGYAGAGGALGANGTAGVARWSGGSCNTDIFYANGGTAGTAGNAIALNGNTATRSGSGTTIGTVS